MIRSMTGFARRERQGPWGTLACEIRSVNHRYLELSLRLPEDLRGLEGDARQAVSAALRRGKVDVGVYLRGQPAQTGTLEFNRALVDQLARTAREVFKAADDASDQPTCDLLTQRMQVHEKTAWMLRSLLE